jgi:hypothetical protein
MEAWPNTLPQYVLVDGYSEEEADNLIEYKPEAGAPISRPRSSNAARPITVAYELSRGQLQDLQEFYRTTLISGSLPFTFPTPNEDTPQIVKFQKGGGPKVTGVGGPWRRVSMSLWIMPS